MSPNQPDFTMGRVEFIGLLAMMFATIAFSIDAMLPALPDIGAELSPLDPSRATLVLTSFVLGMGIGTFITGPLSDSFGRRNIVFAGSILYVISAAVAWQAQSIEVLLAARLVQGLGAAGPRIVSLAIVRDLFSGREMARIMSIVMMIFTLVPALAPAMGAAIIAFSDWRGIFAAFIIFCVISMLWMGLRLPETLAVENRRPFRPSLMINATKEMFSNQTVRLSIYVQTLALAMLFTTLLLIQPIYDQVYDRGESFPYWFGAIALVAGSASFLNALLVVRFGMRRLVTVALCAQIVFSAGMLVISQWVDLSAPYDFWIFLVWQACLFFQAGLTLGNLNAIAMEPMGHIAGMAASVIGSVSTVLAALIASPIGLMFNETVTPLTLSVLIMAVIGYLLMRRMNWVEEHAPPINGAEWLP